MGTGVKDVESLLASSALILRHRADAPRQRLRQALNLVDPGSSTALRLRMRLTGDQSYRAGEAAEMLALLAEARSAGDPIARAEAFSLAHHSLLGPGHGDLRRKLAADLVAESFRTGRRDDLALGVLWQTIDMLLDADPQAGRRLGELRGLLAEHEHPAVGYVVQAIEVMLTVRGGDLVRAEALAEACARRGAAAGYVGASGLHGAQLVAIRWYQGRVVEILPLLLKLVESPTPVAANDSFLAALAVAAAAAGDRPRAVDALARLCGSGLANLPRSSSWLTRMNAIVEAAHLLDDTDVAAQAYELLMPHAHLPIVGSLGAICFGSAHHALAVASITTGHLDRAVGHLDAAIQQNRAIGHWPAVVASRHRLAQVLTLRGRPGDAAEAECQRAAATLDAREVGPGLPCPAGPAKSSDAVPSDAVPSGGTPSEPVPSESVPSATCVRDGRHWQVGLAGRRARVEHRIGMLHLAVLLANPGQEITAADLAAGVSGLTAGLTGLATRPDAAEHPVLDRVAMREYQNRLTRLRQEIGELPASSPAAERARAERDWLVTELGAAAGLGGRTRGFPSNRERARIAVGKAIRRAITQIELADPAIGAHLAHTVHTGTRCFYQPA